MKKIKTYPNHLEIITSVFIPYKDFDLEDFLDVPTVTIQGIMNAWAPVCIEALKMRMDACVQMLEHHRKDIISVNEDAVEFKKDNGSIHRFHIRSYNLMEQTITNFQNGDLSLNRDTAYQLVKALYWIPEKLKAERKGVGFELFISFVLSHLR
jgi:hypothetical protein